jgi:hypothetical protein
MEAAQQGAAGGAKGPSAWARRRPGGSCIHSGAGLGARSDVRQASGGATGRRARKEVSKHAMGGGEVAVRCRLVAGRG